ncbi:MULTISPECIES: SpoIIE family protein phosphatase [unclassified Pseudodesulfovibrio]|uniref:SpoIIE family protein phosphatase n=1 Tax=unclassified Pseudodesulfovibrio TaxID=2661612 RepID=UPI000FEBCE1B|nr:MULTISPECIES: SpoIIE family protein phosphatase [unclassified Pseudodesulfovibrio]MCJ2165672.1 SpoIIE family protein phosphatase [Pseudodesulfovibrio sp. S3-i]
MKISIRIKFFVVLMAFSLAPIFISRGLMGRASSEVIEKTREQTRKELLDIVSDEFEYTASSLLAILERTGNVMQLAAQTVAGEVVSVLGQPALSSAPLPYFSNDFADPDLTPPDAARREGYVRRTMSKVQQSIRVSLEHPTVHLSPGVRLEDVDGELRQLLLAAPVIRGVYSELPSGPFWINVAMESGVFMTFPGHGSLPHMFDPRNQDWYRSARDVDSGKWFSTVDPATRFIMNKLVFPLRDREGRFLGAVSVDTPAHAMMSDNELGARWQGDVRTFLVARVPEEESSGRGLAILVQAESGEGGRRHWMSAPEKEWLTFDDPVGYNVLLHALDTRKSGVMKISYNGQSSVCAFATVDTYAMLVIAPKTVVAKLPDEVSGLLNALFQEVRNISSIISGVMLIITGLIAWFGSRAITKPIFGIVDVAKRLMRGDFAAHIDYRAGDERDDLIEAFNEMGPKLKELMQLNKDMELAQEVQRLLLPSSEPDLAGFDVSGGIAYCDQTGGDYYDFIRICGGEPGMAVVLGDVSGHGVPSALVMAAARGQLHALANIDLAPHERMDSINKVLSRDLDGTGRFLTMFYLHLQENSSSIKWVRAGHDPAIRYNPVTDEFGELWGEGFPLGVVEQAVYATNETRLEAGDILVLATDGVWEAQNSQGEMFGKKRMLAIVRENAHKRAEAIRLAMMAAVEAFQGNGQEDDITVVVVKKDAGDNLMARHSISFRMTNKENCFKCFQPKVEEFGFAHALHPKIIFHLTLALDELITNIISYGYTDFDEHPIDVTIGLEGDILTIQLEDDSEPFNILEAPEPELDVPLEDRLKPVGGMGIHLVKSMVHGISYERKGGKNVLTLHKNISKTHCPVSG